MPFSESLRSRGLLPCRSEILQSQETKALTARGSTFQRKGLQAQNRATPASGWDSIINLCTNQSHYFSGSSWSHLDQFLSMSIPALAICLNLHVSFLCLEIQHRSSDRQLSPAQHPGTPLTVATDQPTGNNGSRVQRWPWHGLNSKDSPSKAFPSWVAGGSSQNPISRIRREALTPQLGDPQSSYDFLKTF